MRTLTLAALLLIVPARAHADEPFTRLRLPFLVLASAGAVDITSTLTNHSNHERNPATAFIPDDHMRLTIAVGAALEVLAVRTLTQLDWFEDRPRLTRVLVYAASGVHVVAATKNWKDRDINARIRGLR